LHPAFGLYWRSRFIAAKAFGLHHLLQLFKHLLLLETGQPQLALLKLIVILLSLAAALAAGVRLITQGLAAVAQVDF
jgi:hypothetical protein